ncbi:MAG: O-antigen ligase family protein [Bryobacteraceae bacterium]
MTRGAALLAVLLSWAVLTLWVPERWAWALFQFAVFAGVGVWAVQFIRHPAPVAGALWILPLGAAAAWGLLQLACGRTVYRWATWEAVLNWSTYAALFFLALQAFRQFEAQRWFLRFALFFGFALAVFSTLQMFTSGGRIFWLFPSGYKELVLGPFVYRNQYAAFMEMILPIAIWQALHARNNSWPYLIMAAAMVASVVAGASRAGSLLMCLEGIAVLLLASYRGVVSTAAVAHAAAKLALLATLFTAVAGWQVLWGRLSRPDQGTGRREFFMASQDMLRDHPWLGVGLGNWPKVYPQYATFDDGSYVNQAHDDWMQWAVEGGLPFALLMAALLVMAVPKAARSLWGVGLIAVWVHCAVDYPFQQRPGLGAWFFVLLGALASEPERQLPYILSWRNNNGYRKNSWGIARGAGSNCGCGFAPGTISCGPEPKAGAPTRLDG